jgi:hypothetical protein
MRGFTHKIRCLLLEKKRVNSTMNNGQRMRESVCLTHLGYVKKGNEIYFGSIDPIQQRCGSGFTDTGPDPGLSSI